jgi:hypothetical protein
MVARLNRWLRRPAVISAVTAAAIASVLTAGFAGAFSGSGSLQKAAVSGLPGQLETFRVLTGVGNLRVVCQTTETNTSADFYFKNKSGKKLAVSSTFVKRIFSTNQMDLFQEYVEVPNGQLRLIDQATPDGPTRYRWHIYPVNGSKRPQVGADVVGVVAQFDPENQPSGCAASSVTFMGLNTEE